MKDYSVGWCYLALIDRSFWKEAKELGYCPNVAAIRRFVNSHANCLAEGHFQLRLGEDANGLLGHVEEARESGLGVQAYQLIAACDKALRVGMSTSVPVLASHDQVAPEHVGRRMELVPGGALERDIHVAFAIDQSTEAFSFKPRDNGRIRVLGVMFESVQLLSASFTMQVTGDNTSQLRCAVTEGLYAPSSNLGWAQAPMGIWAIGNSTGATTTVLELDENHPFGREIKAVPLGAGDPVFHFDFTSDTSALAICRGTLRLRFSGVGVGSAFDIAKGAGRRLPGPKPRGALGSPSAGGKARATEPDSSDDDGEEQSASEQVRRA